MMYSTITGHIGIVGGGNIGTALALELENRGFNVCLYTRNPEIWSKDVDLYEDDFLVCKTRISVVTDDLETLCRSCKTIVITYPPQLFRELSSDMFPLILDGATLIAVPGLGGFEYVFNKFLEKKCTLLGLQRVPAVYRIIERGKSVSIKGRRKEGLHVASIPFRSECDVRSIVESVFNMRCTTLSNYLGITLTPSNPILHTSRLYALFGDYPYDHVFRNNPLFYGDWDDKSSKMLLDCDDELMTILEQLDGIDTSSIRSLKLHYESSTVEAMTDKIRSIWSLGAIKSPMVSNDDGYAVDWGSRYFQSDFPHGLLIIKSISKIVNVDTPTIDLIIGWYQDSLGKSYVLKDGTFGKDILECNIPHNFGIDSLEKLRLFYN